MKLKDIEVGGRYLAKVSGVVPVRVVEIREIPPPSRSSRYAINEVTGRKVTIRSPQRLRARVGDDGDEDSADESLTKAEREVLTRVQNANGKPVLLAGSAQRGCPAAGWARDCGMAKRPYPGWFLRAAGAESGRGNRAPRYGGTCNGP